MKMRKFGIGISEVLLALALVIALVIVVSAGEMPHSSASASPNGERVVWQTVEAPVTKWVRRTITNTVEIWMPTNIFVNEYHTNLRSRFITNLVEVAETNWVGRTVTNTQTVTQFRTNQVTAINTNWLTRSVTNYQTVSLVRTNWETAFRTNYRVLNLTNWETVVEFRTNKFDRKISQVVEINSDGNPATLNTSSAKQSSTAEASATQVDRLPTAELAVSGRIVGEGDHPGEINVRLAAHKAIQNGGESVEITEWLVQREDAPVLFAMKEQEFVRSLKPGTYVVEIRAQYVPSGRQFVSKTKLEVTSKTIRVLGNPDVASRK